MKTVIKSNAFQIIAATAAIITFFLVIVAFAYSVVGLNDMM